MSMDCSYCGIDYGGCTCTPESKRLQDLVEELQEQREQQAEPSANTRAMIAAMFVAAEYVIGALQDTSGHGDMYSEPSTEQRIAWGLDMAEEFWKAFNEKLRSRDVKD